MSEQGIPALDAYDEILKYYTDLALFRIIFWLSELALNSYLDQGNKMSYAQHYQRYRLTSAGNQLQFNILKISFMHALNKKFLGLGMTYCIRT